MLLAGILCVGMVTAVSGAGFQDGTGQETAGDLTEEDTQTSADGQEDVQTGNDSTETDLFTDEEQEEGYAPDSGDLPVFTDGAEEESDLFSADEDGSFSWAEEETEGLEYEYIEETDSYRVVKGVDVERVDIPYSHQGKYVTEIGEEAFAGCENLKYVFFYNIYGNATIRERAFENCTSLRIVNMWGGAVVESNAFSNCPELRRLSPSIYDIKGSKFAEDAFDPDTRVVVSTDGSMTWPEGNEYILYNPEIDWEEKQDGVSYLILETHSMFDRWYTNLAIDYDNSKESITLEKWTMIVWRKAFENADNLREINLNTGDFLMIAEKAFSGCTNLERVIIPDTVQEIADNAFENCPKLTLYVTEGSYAEQYAIEHQIPYEYTPTALEIEKITVNKNMVTVQFSEFTGDMYYCVLGTGKTDDGVPVRSGNSGRIAVSQTGNQVTFRNVAQGNYYIGARALSLDGDAKVYSKWSDLGEAEITVTTPERPSISSITQSGNRLRVVPSIPDGADGYIVTVGRGTTKNDSSTAAVAVPSQKAGSRTVSGTGAVTLRNAKPGTYYIGIQTFIRNSDGSKTYSQWSPLKRFTVK